MNSGELLINSKQIELIQASSLTWLKHGVIRRLLFRGEAFKVTVAKMKKFAGNYQGPRQSISASVSRQKRKIISIKAKIFE
jgi:hypothetical protein